MFNVYHFIPWDSEKNIARSYNKSMELLRDEDWACFLDGDAVHTTIYFGKRIEEIIENNPEYSLFTCYTNRIGCPYQIAPGVDVKSNDQAYHRNIGEALWNKNKSRVIDITNSQLLSGVLILISKKAWLDIGKIKEGKMLGIDNQIHLKIKEAKKKVGLMSGIYVQHWYRGGDQQNKKHLL